MANYFLNNDDVDVIIGALIHFDEKVNGLIDFFQESVEREECDNCEHSCDRNKS